jgi:hypothetical protein
MRKKIHLMRKEIPFLGKQREWENHEMKPPLS